MEYKLILSEEERGILEDFLQDIPTKLLVKNWPSTLESSFIKLEEAIKKQDPVIPKSSEDFFSF